MVHRLVNIALAGSLASALTFPVFLPLPAQAQGAGNCYNVLKRECSNSPNAPKSGSDGWSSSTAGGGGLGAHHR